MARGWLDDAGELTEGGRVTRRAVEDATDELALEPWAALGKEGSERLAELLEPVARAVAHDIPLPNPIGLSRRGVSRRRRWPPFRPSRRRRSA